MADRPLPDGTYDVFVVDASDPRPDGSIELELTVVAGDHKGEVVSLGATHLGADPIGLMGMPATLVVAEGAPRLTIDD
jgi:hypothetical protein